MKKGIEVVYLDLHSPEWYEFRLSGIGGSEVGTIMGINKYSTWMRTFHEKLGLVDQRTEDNNLMFWGREHEDKIAEIWQYWDDTPDGYIVNKKNGRIIRKCRNVNGYIRNPKFPWLFASVDRLMNKDGGVNFITGEILPDSCPLECKTLSYWASTVWESKIPQYFYSQVQTYMIILEVDYAEIGILKDGNKFYVEYVQRDPGLCEKIIYDTKNFWYDRVVPGKEAKKKRDYADIQGDIQMWEEYEGIIQHLEPPPDDTEAYKLYMSKKFLYERESIQGTFGLYEAGKRDEVLKKISQEIDRQRRLIGNQMIEYLVRNHCDLIDFGKDGTARWYTKRNIEGRVLNINMSEKPSDDIIYSEFQKINQQCY